MQTTWFIFYHIQSCNNLSVGGMVNMSRQVYHQRALRVKTISQISSATVFSDSFCGSVCWLWNSENKSCKNKKKNKKAMSNLKAIKLCVYLDQSTSLSLTLTSHQFMESYFYVFSFLRNECAISHLLMCERLNDIWNVFNISHEIFCSFVCSPFAYALK